MVSSKSACFSNRAFCMISFPCENEMRSGSPPDFRQVVYCLWAPSNSRPLAQFHKREILPICIKKVVTSESSNWLSL